MNFNDKQYPFPEERFKLEDTNWSGWPSHRGAFNGIAAPNLQTAFPLLSAPGEQASDGIQKGGNHLARLPQVINEVIVREAHQHFLNSCGLSSSETYWGFGCIPVQGSISL